jgi:methylenetetrahydrofolate dehydrogenase (NAD+)
MASSSSPQGVQITASKVHVPFKTELINAISSERFAQRPPHLVGILATDKEDAKTYAEVSGLLGFDLEYSLAESLSFI